MRLLPDGDKLSSITPTRSNNSGSFTCSGNLKNTVLHRAKFLQRHPEDTPYEHLPDVSVHLQLNISDQRKLSVL